MVELPALSVLLRRWRTVRNITCRSGLGIGLVQIVVWQAVELATSGLNGDVVGRYVGMIHGIPPRPLAKIRPIPRIAHSWATGSVLSLGGMAG